MQDAKCSCTQQHALSQNCDSYLVVTVIASACVLYTVLHPAKTVHRPQDQYNEYSVREEAESLCGGRGVQRLLCRSSVVVHVKPNHHTVSHIIPLKFRRCTRS